MLFPFRFKVVMERDGGYVVEFVVEVEGWREFVTRARFVAGQMVAVQRSRHGWIQKFKLQCASPAMASPTRLSSGSGKYSVVLRQ